MKRVKQSTRYAMDGHTPIRHVVTQLEGAGDRPLSLNDLTFSYKHFVLADFHRIKLHEKLSGDHAAKQWLMEYAVSELGPEIIEVINGMDDSNPSYRLKVPLEKVIYEGKRIALNVKDVPQFSGGNDPYNQLNGIFVENIRDKSEDNDLTDLRASMQAMGWVQTSPAIRDEHGIVLVGHRRLKVAAELGIEPVWHDVRLGNGEAASVERLKIALSSNVGFKPMTPTTRKRIAEYLYGEKEWSMEKVAAALQVTKMTVSRDLDKVVTDVTTPRVSKRGRVGEGRPRGGKISAKKDRARKAVSDLVTAGQLFNRDELAEQLGTSNAIVDDAKAFVEGYQRGLEERAESQAASTEEHEHVWVCNICGVPHP